MPKSENLVGRICYGGRQESTGKDPVDRSQGSKDGEILGHSGVFVEAAVCEACASNGNCLGTKE